jgi:hypothetical protein
MSQLNPQEFNLSIRFCERSVFSPLVCFRYVLCILLRIYIRDKTVIFAGEIKQQDMEFLERRT